MDPFIKTLAPGRGEPSGADVTLPVMLISWPYETMLTDRKTSIHSVRKTVFIDDKDEYDDIIIKRNN